MNSFIFDGQGPLSIFSSNLLKLTWKGSAAAYAFLHVEGRDNDVITQKYSLKSIGILSVTIYYDVQNMVFTTARFFKDILKRSSWDTVISVVVVADSRGINMSFALSRQ